MGLQNILLVVFVLIAVARVLSGASDGLYILASLAVMVFLSRSVLYYIKVKGRQRQARIDYFLNGGD